jgi:PhoH-like ATPase
VYTRDQDEMTHTAETPVPVDEASTNPKKPASVKKTYVLDTNVLLSDANSIYSFDEHNVIIPMAVLEELDRHKSRPDEVGRNARHVSRTLDELRGRGSLADGVVLPSGGKLRIVSVDPDVFRHVPVELREQKVDNLIIAFMVQVKRAHEAAGSAIREPHVLVSKDINVRVKCDSLGVRCEDYLKMRVAADPQQLYRGVEVVEVDEELVDQFYCNGKLDLPSVVLGHRKLHHNQIVVIKSVKDGQTIKSALTKCVDPTRPLVPVAKIEQAFGLKPRNKEQAFSLDLLFDDSIKLLTLVGPSGTGKTLLALAAGLEQLRGLGSPASARYDKLIVTRPVQPVGKDIGFLPGTLEEKMEPWIAPIRDNLNFLMDSRRSRPKRKRSDSGDKPMLDDNLYLKLMQERGLIEIEAITFIRGRSIPNAFIVIDEAQNLSMHELKTIVTRVGDGTKIVLTGDIEQIDNVHVDVFTNGLTCAVEKFKDYPIAGHVTLMKGERSALATLASQIL